MPDDNLPAQPAKKGLKIDEAMLTELGLAALPAADKKALLDHIMETLETRVGMRLASKMSDEQLDEFEKFIDTGDQDGAVKWLEANYPNYAQVVAEELVKLKAEIKKDAPKIQASFNQSNDNPAGNPNA